MKPDGAAREVWVLCDVHIRHISTGEVRVHESKELMSDPHLPGGRSDYIWVFGNYVCDCNRSLFFERAAGQAPSLDETECTTGKYVVDLIKRRDTGEVLLEGPA